MPTNKKTQRQLDNLTRASQDAFHFVVVGKGSFPVDMLRYDKCWPASEFMSGLIVNTSHQTNHPDSHRIELRGLKTPTVGRWSSFGWRVVAIENERVA